MCARALPGGNEVLGQVDADRCSCDRDMAVARPVQLAADLDLRTRHLPDLVDLSALAADDRADQLRGEQRARRMSERDGKKMNGDVDGLEEDRIQSHHLTVSRSFFPFSLLFVSDSHEKKKKKKRGGGGNPRAVESTLMRTTSSVPITLSSVDWSSIMHVKSTFSPPESPL